MTLSVEPQLEGWEFETKKLPCIACSGLSKKSLCSRLSEIVFFEGPEKANFCLDCSSSLNYSFAKPSLRDFSSDSNLGHCEWFGVVQKLYVPVVLIVGMSIYHADRMFQLRHCNQVENG